jgi:hypothetical protein
MIEINNIEDLRPYIKYIPAKLINGNTSYLNFEMAENGELQDVVINCKLDLTFSFDNIFSNLFNIENTIAEDTIAQICDIRFIAKDVYANTEFICDYMECDNLYFKDKVSLKFLVASGMVKGKSISSMDIMCDTLDAEYVYCSCVNVINFKAKSHYGKDMVMTNVSFHHPVFAESLVKSWKGVKVKKYNLVNNYDTCPF